MPHVPAVKFHLNFKFIRILVYISLYQLLSTKPTHTSKIAVLVWYFVVTPVSHFYSSHVFHASCMGECVLTENKPLQPGQCSLVVTCLYVFISMAWRGTAVTPVRTHPWVTHWSCRGLALGQGCSAWMILCVGACVFLFIVFACFIHFTVGQ